MCVFYCVWVIVIVCIGLLLPVHFAISCAFVSTVIVMYHTEYVPPVFRLRRLKSCCCYTEYALSVCTHRPTSTTAPVYGATTTYTLDCRTWQQRHATALEVLVRCRRHSSARKQPHVHVWPLSCGRHECCWFRDTTTTKNTKRGSAAGYVPFRFNRSSSRHT